MNIAGLRSIGSAAAACFARRSWVQSAQTSVVRVERRADTPGGSREYHCARARCILRSAVGPVAPAWRITAERAAQRRDTASRNARLAHPLCNHCGRQHASDGGRDSVRADRSSGRPTPCHRVGARHDGLAAEMHAVAFLGAERGHPRARPDRDSWLGRGRDRLLLRREGWPASVPDRRRRSARDARFGPCRAADVRAYARQTHGGVGLLAGGTRSALDRHCRAALRAGPRNPRRRGNRTGRKH